MPVLQTKKGINMPVKLQLFQLYPCKQFYVNADTNHFSGEFFMSSNWVSEAAASGVVLDSSINIFGVEILLFIRTTTIVMEDMQKMTMIQEIPRKTPFQIQNKMYNSNRAKCQDLKKR